MGRECERGGEEWPRRGCLSGVGGLGGVGVGGFGGVGVGGFGGEGGGGGSASQQKNSLTLNSFGTTNFVPRIPAKTWSWMPVIRLALATFLSTITSPELHGKRPPGLLESASIS